MIMMREYTTLSDSRRSSYWLASYLVGSRSSQLLVAILLLSVVLRLAAAIYLGDQVEILPGTYDQISYDTLAQRLVAGHGFTFATEWWPATRAGEPTAHWSFLYTLYLTAVYWLFGPHPLVARLIQAVWPAS